MESFVPQLVMRKPHLRDLPPVELPSGYSIRSFREGDDTHWERIIRITFENPEYDFNKAMRNDSEYQPKRIKFVIHNDTPVATASAWWFQEFGPEAGYLHMVGVSPEHRGKHLGYWVSMAVLHHFVLEQRTEAVLRTDDFRRPAIRTYIKMGFDPMLVHENQRNRWTTILQDMGYADLLLKYKSILDGPIHSIQ